MCVKCQYRLLFVASAATTVAADSIDAAGLFENDPEGIELGDSVREYLDLLHQANDLMREQAQKLDSECDPPEGTSTQRDLLVLRQGFLSVAACQTGMEMNRIAQIRQIVGQLIELGDEPGDDEQIEDLLNEVSSRFDKGDLE